MEKKISNLIDTHAHLTFPQFDEDRKEVIERAQGSGIEFIITVGAGDGLDGNRAAVELAEENPRIFATVGVHPHDASEIEESWFADLRNFARSGKVVGIGEIGLDYHHRHSEPEAQRKWFRRLMELANELDKPVVIHDRDAHEDIWKAIMEVGIPKRKGVFHCFSGDVKFAKEIVDAGFFISVPGVVTFKNAKDLQEVVSVIPLERLMLETDCPYLAPEPYRGKRNEPSYVREIAEKVAFLKGLSADDVARVTSLNAKKLFGLPGAELETHIAYQIRNSLYLNITNSCNLACRFCPKFTDYEVKGYYLKLLKEPDVDEVFQAMGQPEKYDEVVFCGYGEPTRRIEVLKVIAKRMKDRGVRRVRLNTDGLVNLLYGRNVLPELQGIIDSISVSLNSADSKFYAAVCPSKFGEKAFDAVCAFIIEAKSYIPEVVASVVALPDLDIESCRRKAAELGVPLRVREYMNVG